MAIKKGAGGVEDLTFGMSTATQLRNGKEVTITQINAGNIPYSTTQSISQKMENDDGVVVALRTDLDNHKSNSNNPHAITAPDIGAAPKVHTHVIGDVEGLQTDLNNKAQVEHTHEISAVTGLQTQLDSKLEEGEAFKKTDHITEGGAAVNAGKPIVLDSNGKLHPTLSGSGLYPVAMYTPDAVNEYADPTGETFGAYWGIIGVTEYTFVGGDLAGETVHPNDSVIYGSQGWGVFKMTGGSSDFYRIDGTVAISAPFAGGGQQVKNIAVATEAGDAVEYSQIAGLTTQFMLLDGTLDMKANLPTGGFKVVGMADGTADTDAVTFQQLATKAPDTATKVRDTTITINEGGVANEGIINFDTAGFGNDYDARVRVAGGTDGVTGKASMHFTAGDFGFNSPVHCDVQPTTSSELTRKDYVDARTNTHFLYTSDFGCVGDGVADDTIAFKNALIAAFPLDVTLVVEGNVRLTGTIVINNSVSLVGTAMPEIKEQGGADSYNGSWFFLDHADTGFNYTGNPYNTSASINMIGFRREQDEPTDNTWVPRIQYGPDVYIDQFHDIDIQDCAFIATLYAIRVYSAGRIFIRNIRAQVFKEFLDIREALDIIRADGIHIWAMWRDSVHIHNYTLQNATAFKVTRADNAMYSNIFTIYMRYGFRAVEDPAVGYSSAIKVTNVDFDRGNQAISIEQDNFDGAFVNLSAMQEPPYTGITPVQCNGEHIQLALTNVKLSGAKGSAVLCEGGTNTVLSLDNVTLIGWDDDSTGDVGINASSPSTISISGTLLYDTGNATGAITGGTGTINKSNAYEQNIKL